MGVAREPACGLSRKSADATAFMPWSRARSPPSGAPSCATPARGMRRHSVLTVAAACIFLACTLPTTQSDAGTGDAGPQTVGDQCSAIALAFCNRAIGGCGFADTLSDCVANEVLSCCTGSECNAISKSSQSALDACDAAIAFEDCHSVVTFGPRGLASCQGVPQKP
jgi:hypothetical protein